MASWRRFEIEAPLLAAEVKRVFAPGEGHVLATVRRDGSPRVSGIEVQFEAGERMFGSMAGARKVADLHRDSRCAVHSRPASGGDAEIYGRVDEAVRPSATRKHHSFLLHIEQVTFIDVEGGDHLLIQTWRPGRDVANVARY